MAVRLQYPKQAPVAQLDRAQPSGGSSHPIFGHEGEGQNQVGRNIIKATANHLAPLAQLDRAYPSGG